jgi:glycosyltransferase involved in cell wall biosynthesis
MARMDIGNLASVWDSVMRIGIDLSGSLESMEGGMSALAVQLENLGMDLVRFRLARSSKTSVQTIPLKAWWRPLWKVGRGPAIDRLLNGCEIVHVASDYFPPVRDASLVVSIDDLRPLRESGVSKRVNVIRRVAEIGAVIVVPTRAAAREALVTLHLERQQVFVVPPPIPQLSRSHGGELVITIAGAVDRFNYVADQLLRVARDLQCPVTILASAKVRRQITHYGVKVLPHARAAEVVARARMLVEFSDGARFPSIAVAALSASVPVISTSTELSRQVLGGAAILVDEDREFAEIVDALWRDEARRRILESAGPERAADFSAEIVAERYAALYRSIVKG